MHGLRAFFRDRHRFAILVIALALCLKAAIPAGYMVAGNARTIAVAVCADTEGKRLVRRIAIPMEESHRSDTSAGHAKSAGDCAFAGLAFAALGGADVLLLAAALLFVFALGHLPVVSPRLRALRYRHPPSRGPPLRT